MYVAEELGTQTFRSLLIGPGAGVAEQEALDRGESTDRFSTAELPGLLERIEREEHVAVVRQILTEAGLAIDGYTGQRLEGVVLRDHYGGPFLKTCRILCRPTIRKVAAAVEHPALVVKAVGDLVADGGGCGIISHSVRSTGIPNFAIMSPNCQRAARIRMARISAILVILIRR